MFISIISVLVVWVLGKSLAIVASKRSKTITNRRIYVNDAWSMAKVCNIHWGVAEPACKYQSLLAIDDYDYDDPVQGCNPVPLGDALEGCNARMDAVPVGSRVTYV